MRKQRDSRHKIMRAPPSTADLKILARRAGYGGNPAHKRNPGDFGLPPPSDPRPFKTLCDEIGVMSGSR